MFFAVYDLQDNLIAVCEDYEELTSWLGHKHQCSVRNSISRFLKGEIESIISKKDGKRYKVYKIKESD